MSLSIDISQLPETKMPEWSEGRVIVGVKEPRVLDLEKLMSATYFLEEYPEGRWTTGHTILASLVKSYKVDKDEPGKVYTAEPDDLIHGHFGLKELLWIKENWIDLPMAFHRWTYRKMLYGNRDMWRVGKRILTPCLDCGTSKPHAISVCLSFRWNMSDFSLHGSVE